MTCWQSLFETVGISRHLRELPSGNSSSRRDLLPAFDPMGNLINQMIVFKTIQRTLKIIKGIFFCVKSK